MKQRVLSVFNVPDCSLYKKYKVYCLRQSSGNIFYIGCTKSTLMKRCGEHVNDSFTSKSRRHILESHINSGNKMSIQVLYDFDNKHSASITERILINFYKNYIDSSIINSHCIFEESHIIDVPKSLKHY